MLPVKKKMNPGWQWKELPRHGRSGPEKLTAMCMKVAIRNASGEFHPEYRKGKKNPSPRPF
jgi:hypothetical protein